MVKNFLNRLRQATTILCAVFLWVHALLFVLPHIGVVAGANRLLRLEPAELLLFLLIFVFTALSAVGFWRAVLSLIYIYFFPFVLLWYVVRICYAILKRVNGWLTSDLQEAQESIPPLVLLPATIEGRTLQNDETQPAKPKEKDDSSMKLAVRFLSRPFTRYPLLWGIVIAVTAHKIVLACAIVILIVQIVRRAWLFFNLIFFSNSALTRLVKAVQANVVKNLEAFLAVKLDSASEADLKSLWTQVRWWKRALKALRQEEIVSRWLWLAGVILSGLAYSYFAVLFSFVYFGVARLYHQPLTWPDSLVIAIFIPFLITNLPRLVSLEVLSGTHCFLVVVSSVGTLLSVIRRHLADLRDATRELGARFDDREIEERVEILSRRFETTPKPVRSADAVPNTDNKIAQ